MIKYLALALAPALSFPGQGFAMRQENTQEAGGTGGLEALRTALADLADPVFSAWQIFTDPSQPIVSSNLDFNLTVSGLEGVLDTDKIHHSLDPLRLARPLQYLVLDSGGVVVGSKLDDMISPAYINLLEQFAATVSEGETAGIILLTNGSLAMTQAQVLDHLPDSVHKVLVPLASSGAAFPAAEHILPEAVLGVFDNFLGGLGSRDKVLAYDQSVAPFVQAGFVSAESEEHGYAIVRDDPSQLNQVIVLLNPEWAKDQTEWDQWATQLRKSLTQADVPNDLLETLPPFGPGGIEWVRPKLQTLDMVLQNLGVLPAQTWFLDDSVRHHQGIESWPGIRIFTGASNRDLPGTVIQTTPADFIGTPENLLDVGMEVIKLAIAERRNLAGKSVGEVVEQVSVDLEGSTGELHKTVLDKWHRSHGGRMVDFGGFSMPVQYTSILEEYTAVRTKTGLFDVSHMGIVEVKGSGAKAFLNRVATHRVDKRRISKDRVVDLVEGDCQVCLIFDDDGDLIDETMIFKLSDENYRLVVNAGHSGEVIEWLESVASRSEFTGEMIEIDDLREPRDAQDSRLIFALQGPETLAALAGVMNQADHAAIGDMKPLTHREVTIGDVKVLISKTGWTGEKGFEFMLDPEDVPQFWSAPIGQGIPPIGLGARDLLRLEASLRLRGSDFWGDVLKITPAEAGYGDLGFIDWDSGVDFIGKGPLGEREAESNRRVVNIVMVGTSEGRIDPDKSRRLIEQGSVVRVRDSSDEWQEVGQIRSSGLSKIWEGYDERGAAIASALINDRAYTQPGQEVQVELRGKLYYGRVLPGFPKPMYWNGWGSDVDLTKMGRFLEEVAEGNIGEDLSAEFGGLEATHRVLIDGLVKNDVLVPYPGGREGVDYETKDGVVQLAFFESIGKLTIFPSKGLEEETNSFSFQDQIDDFGGADLRGLQIVRRTAAGGKLEFWADHEGQGVFVTDIQYDSERRELTLMINLEGSRLNLSQAEGEIPERFEIPITDVSLLTILLRVTGEPEETVGAGSKQPSAAGVADGDIKPWADAAAWLLADQTRGMKLEFEGQMGKPGGQIFLDSYRATNGPDKLAMRIMNLATQTWKQPFVHFARSGNAIRLSGSATGESGLEGLFQLPVGDTAKRMVVLTPTTIDAGVQLLSGLESASGELVRVAAIVDGPDQAAQIQSGLELAPIALQVWDLSQAAGRTVGDLIEAIEFDAWKQRLDTYVVHGSSWFRGLGRFLGFKSVSLRAWDQRADQAILRYQL